MIFVHLKIKISPLRNHFCRWSQTGQHEEKEEYDVTMFSVNPKIIGEVMTKQGLDYLRRARQRDAVKDSIVKKSDISMIKRREKKMSKYSIYFKLNNNITII